MKVAIRRKEGCSIFIGQGLVKIKLMKLEVAKSGQRIAKFEIETKAGITIKTKGIIHNYRRLNQKNFEIACMNLKLPLGGSIVIDSTVEMIFEAVEDGGSVKQAVLFFISETSWIEIKPAEDYQQVEK